ncbi:hypothetical protein SAMN05444422_11456 [Halobiforma haloterrestris]|uniref:Winged helix-turn-helix n=1 Tax=Natronobacterium haloterrestre TaxID=148448 RepID=A0A1I1LE48_NATHA|nr:hypothetical protein [Halobiforma haloterrestris]SFC67800.1 hypothetical protein SAMN05444422_11456 [Halobiforma haloterrestris]
MTATKTDRVRSDNSVSRDRDRRETPGVTPENDPRLHRIVQLANQRDGPSTRNDIAGKSGWLLEEVDDYLEWLRQGNYVQWLEEDRTIIVLLTGRGEKLAEGIL